MRKTVTIPAAGEILTVKMTGQSVIVEEMNVYSQVEQVPTMALSPGISDYPLYPRSVYPNNDTFNQVVITGTSESEGDEITLLSTDQCLQLEINILFASTSETVAGETVDQAATDAAQSLNLANLLDADGRLPTAIYISAKSFDINYAFDADPNNTDFGHTLLAGTEQLEKIVGLDFIQKFKFANQTAGSNGNLIITPEY